MGSQRIGTVRSSQIITTYGPGALLDLPEHSVIVAGLDTWSPNDLPEIIEPRLTNKIWRMTNVEFPRLYAPPPDSGPPGLARRLSRVISASDDFQSGLLSRALNLLAIPIPAVLKVSHVGSCV